MITLWVVILKPVIEAALTITGGTIFLKILDKIRLAIVSKADLRTIFGLICAFLVTTTFIFWLNASYFTLLWNGAVYVANTCECFLSPCQPPGSEGDLVTNVGDRVFFDDDSSSLSAAAQSTLTGVAKWLLKNPSVNIQVAGNTDGPSDTDNSDDFSLGSWRAEAVRDYLANQYNSLLGHSIDASRIGVISYGNNCPVAKGSDANSSRKNRNVIISVEGFDPQSCDTDYLSGDTEELLVFFADGQYKLAFRDKDIIEDAAQSHHNRFVLLGYTDSFGTPEDDEVLSQSRTKAVADQLVADGVPASEIHVKALGKENLLVPTGDGVHEMQNNRVEIIMESLCSSSTSLSWTSYFCL